MTDTGQSDVGRVLQQLPTLWGTRPIPDAVDGQLGRLVEDYAVGEPERRENLVARDPNEADSLHIYAKRLATLAVRRCDPGLLRAALVALDMAAPGADFREGLLALVLVHHSAELLGTTTTALADDVAGVVTPHTVESVRRFEARKSRDRSLDAFYYHTEGTGEDFRYVQGLSQTAGDTSR